MNAVSFFCSGIPSPGGSKRVFPLRKSGLLTGKFVVTDAGGEKTKLWRQSVAGAAFLAMQKAELAPFTLPLRVSFIFWMPRPANHHKGSDRAKELKPDAPHWHFKAPDLLKLSRSTEDAMSGIVYTDDKLIAQSSLEKLYVFAARSEEAKTNPGYVTGCSITVTEMT